MFEIIAMDQKTNQARSAWRFIHFLWVPIVGGWFGYSPLKVTPTYAAGVIMFVGVLGAFIGSGWAMFGKWQSSLGKALIICALFGALVFAIGAAGLMALAWALGHANGGAKGALLGVVGALIWGILAMGSFRIVFASLKRFLGQRHDARSSQSSDSVSV